jgi:hypothetical protein
MRVTPPILHRWYLAEMDKESLHAFLVMIAVGLGIACVVRFVYNRHLAAEPFVLTHQVAPPSYHGDHAEPPR